MDYEKKYNNALERALKLIVQNPFDTVSQMMEHVFPELKESEDERIKREILDLVSIAGNGNQFEEIKDWLDKKIVVNNITMDEYNENAKALMPELAESEDERIRKGITELVKQSSEILDKKNQEQMLAWLEKQGEQKPIGKVEPKFKVGDKVYALGSRFKCTIERSIDEGTYYGDTTNFDIKDQDNWELVEHESTKNVHFIPQKDEYYICIKDYYSADGKTTHTKGKIYKSPCDGYINDDRGFGLSWINSCTEEHFRPVKEKDWIVCEQNNVIGKPLQYKEFINELTQKSIKSLEDKGIVPNLRLWTIQDAKDGDVLVDVYGNIGIFEKHDDFDWTSYYSLGCNGGFRCFRVEHENDKTHPATKEQRDLLFKKMHEAGYEWDAEKKELKLLITNGGDFESMPTEEEVQKLHDHLEMHKQLPKSEPQSVILIDSGTMQVIDKLNEIIGKLCDIHQVLSKPYIFPYRDYVPPQMPTTNPIPGMDVWYKTHGIERVTPVNCETLSSIEIDNGKDNDKERTN